MEVVKNLSCVCLICRSYVCMYVYMHLCIYVRTYVCMYVCNFIFNLQCVVCERFVSTFHSHLRTNLSLHAFQQPCLNCSFFTSCHYFSRVRSTYMELCIISASPFIFPFPSLFKLSLFIYFFSTFLISLLVLKCLLC